MLAPSQTTHYDHGMDDLTTKQIVDYLLIRRNIRTAKDAANLLPTANELCSKHGIYVRSEKADYDADMDQVQHRIVVPGKPKPLKADGPLLDTVVHYCNSEYIYTENPDKSRFTHIFATKGNQGRIELLFQFLLKARERLLKVSDKPGWQDTGIHNSSFRLAFEAEVGRIARRQKCHECARTHPIDVPGHEPMIRPKMELVLARELLAKKYPDRVDLLRPLEYMRYYK